MQIIPVIDIKQGQVVHAVRGQRDQYQPLQSKLCNGSNPNNIVAAFLKLYPFSVVYVADLDAITGQGNNNEIINTIYNDFPQLTLWLDSGISTLKDIKNKKSLGMIDVIGTETGINKDELFLIKKRYPDSVLSLDYADGQLLGDASILFSIDAWQNSVIVMTLNRVGSNIGPDLESIKAIKELTPGKCIYAAGGISDFKDLKALQQIKIDGALVATAFHSENITNKELTLLLEST
jgi:phosphoribosylformimino-5-aminoimidazole carboxamide ribotide isomerase